MYSQEDYIKELAGAYAVALAPMATLDAAVRCAVSTLRRGGTVFVAGNGGSAAQASHLVGEMVGRFVKPGRPGLRFHSLPDSPAVLTAWANDEEASSTFARQVEALTGPDDCLIVISTSGESSNLIKAVGAARHRFVKTVAFLGSEFSSLAGLVDVAVTLPPLGTPATQDLHSILIHRFCFGIEEMMVP